MVFLPVYLWWLTQSLVWDTADFPMTWVESAYWALHSLWELPFRTALFLLSKEVMTWDVAGVTLEDPSIPGGPLPTSSVIWTSSSRASNLLQKMPVLRITFSEGGVILLLVHAVTQFQLSCSTGPNVWNSWGSWDTSSSENNQSCSFPQILHTLFTSFCSSLTWRYRSSGTGHLLEENCLFAPPSYRGMRQSWQPVPWSLTEWETEVLILVKQRQCLL